MPRARHRIRYAVAGLGHIAQSAVLPAFGHASTHSALTALVSGDPGKLQALGDRYGVEHRAGYETFADVFDHIDAVYVCTPNTEHERLVVEAAAAGKHVLCEKPLAASSEACERMIAACDAAGVRLMTAYRLHFEPGTLEVLREIRQGRIGEPRYFTSAFSMQTRPGGIRTDPALGGGALWDIGIYCINAARMVFGSEPERVSAHVVDGARSGMPGVDETTAAVLHFSDDRLAAFAVSFDAADVSTFRVVGTRGSIVVDPAYEIRQAIAHTVIVDETRLKRRGRKVDQFAAEIRAFSDCLLHDREPEASGREGWWDVRIIEALYESAARGEHIALPPFREPAPSTRQAAALPPVPPPPLVKVEAPHEE